MTASLYRKYRPQTFAEVVGQDAIERTLRNAIAQDKVSHAYLFCGPRGTGKTTTARLMAKALLCEHGPTPDPDGTCEACQEIADGLHPDVYELDAASRTGVENVREEIINRVPFAPTRGRCKIYIIDEVHMLSNAAFNALLKTLEEPPSHVVFILCTTDPQKVPATIHSRCQRFDFHRISSDEIVARLGAVCVAEGVEFDPEALELVANRSDGGMRNALTALEQLIVFCDGKVSKVGAESLLGAMDSDDMAQIVGAIGRRDAAACFKWTADYVDSGADLAQFVRDMTAHVRNLYVLSIAGEDAPVELSAQERAQCVAELPFFSTDRLARLLGIMGELTSELRFANNPRLCFEIALTRMVRPDSDITLEALAERVDTLERALAGKTAALAAAANVQPARPVAAANVQPVRPAPVASAPKPASAQTPASASTTHQPRHSVAPVSSPRPQVTPQRTPAPTSMPASGPKSVPVSASGSSSAAAEVSASAGSASVDLNNPIALQRAWQNVVALMKREKAAYGVFFLNTKVAPSDSGDAIVVTYSADSSFAFNAVRKPDVQEALAGCVCRVFNASIPVHCVQAGNAGGGSVTPRVAMPAARPAPASAAHASTPAPRSAPVSQPVSAKLPNSASSPRAAAPVPCSSPVSDSVPEYDQVPLDAYGDQASYDDYDPSYDSSYDPGYAPRGVASAPIPQAAAAASASQSNTAVPAPQSAAVPTLRSRSSHRAAYGDPSQASYEQESPTATNGDTAPRKPVPAFQRPAPVAPAAAASATSEPLSVKGAAESVEDVQNLLSSVFGGTISFEELPE